MNTITNYDRTISSENIVEEIDYLENLGSDKLWNDIEYLAKLNSLLWQCRNLEAYNFTLIHEDCLTQLCKETVLCGYLPKMVPDFIINNIDWVGVASDMRSDYNKIDFDGQSYFLKHA